ncbi:Transient receptor potential channel,Transient receptor potential channel, canonical,Ion transport [Cinara cedri]|uniref:Transient receptor potential channel,Transient receptor potential channel, canonical,Ion transport n=1 Tax=Cinara cedri TaxID=506608 RepID=A0A5E4NQY0_9HEMI|nr:Transient receptor potential channel,Transient receptor potential channel, canonical,Ion transport [Cinara cedri]
MTISQSKEDLIGSKEQLRGDRKSFVLPPDYVLSPTEKKFLLLAERGDCASVQRLLDEHKGQPDILNINCTDPLNRSALITAIENENMDLIQLLLKAGIMVKDALLHAIKEEYVEAVELLLEWEEKIHVIGEPYSWEAVESSASTFTPDITPLTLAAHMNNYEILKILLDRGATLPMPHDVRCGCDECITSNTHDSLRHSHSRINAYKALSSPSLIALSSRDPLLTAFELSWELRRLSTMESEFRNEYNEMRNTVQTFATSLLDHVRTSYELEIMLNHNPKGDPWEPGERLTLERLKLAIKYKQKAFVAHPNVQQLLAAIWYDGLPGFRRKSMVGQMIEVGKLGAMFPMYGSMYMLNPDSKMGQLMKKPFIKFVCHSSSYAFFLTLLALASQRAEFLALEWIDTEWTRSILEEMTRKERGSIPGPIEAGIILYIISLIWREAHSLYSDGLVEYIADLWNIVDFITNVFYMVWISLRVSSWYIVQREYSQGYDPWLPRENWDQFDPHLVSEGAFAAAMIFSFLKLVHIFSVNPHLGPLQISLGRMIIDIIKFFFIYTLVLCAFGCGLNQLLWYYADLESKKCYHDGSGVPDFDKEDKACTTWRRFANIFETSQSLFWAGFGLVDLMAFDLTGIKSFTRFWGLLLFGSYSVINIIVLLNMLIAMMSNSYQIISERSDMEWKFARSSLWISYFEDGDTVPAPFNLFPSLKNIKRMIGLEKTKRTSGSMIFKSREKAMARHDIVMRLLVRRYVTAEQRKSEEFGITEDDVMEIRQDISSMRFEMIDIFKRNGYKTPAKEHDPSVAQGKKGRVMERRLLKDFQIGLVEGLIQDAISSNEKGPKDVFSKIAKAIGRRTSQGSKKKDWNAMVRQKSLVRDPIGSTAEGAERRHRQSVRRYILDHQKDALMDANKLIEYNPLLAEITPMARLAYAKFKIPKIKQEYAEENTVGADEVFENAPAVNVIDETSKTKSSIVRPRPKSTRKSPLAAGALPYPSSPSSSSPAGSTKRTDATDPGGVSGPQQPAGSSNQVQSTGAAGEKLEDIKNQSVAPAETNTGGRPDSVNRRKPAPDIPRESAAADAAGKPGPSKESALKEAGDANKAEGSGDGDKTTGPEGDKGSGGDKAKESDRDKAAGSDKTKGPDADKTKDPGKDKDVKHLKPESPKRTASPRKQGGKSKVTGEILTGWL